MRFKRKLYTRGHSFETTIPKPLLFELDMDKKQIPKTNVEYNEETSKTKKEDEQQLVNTLLSAQRVLKNTLIGIEIKPEDINQDINEIVIDNNNNNK